VVSAAFALEKALFNVEIYRIFTQRFLHKKSMSKSLFLMLKTADFDLFFLLLII